LVNRREMWLGKEAVSGRPACPLLATFKVAPAPSPLPYGWPRGPNGWLPGLEPNWYSVFGKPLCLAAPKVPLDWHAAPFTTAVLAEFRIPRTRRGPGLQSNARVTTMPRWVLKTPTMPIGGPGGGPSAGPGREKFRKVGAPLESGPAIAHLGIFRKDAPNTRNGGFSSPEIGGPSGLPV